MACSRLVLLKLIGDSNINSKTVEV